MDDTYYESTVNRNIPTYKSTNPTTGQPINIFVNSNQPNNNNQDESNDGNSNSNANSNSNYNSNSKSNIPECKEVTIQDGISTGFWIYTLSIAVMSYVFFMFTIANQTEYVCSNTPKFIMTYAYILGGILGGSVLILYFFQSKIPALIRYLLYLIPLVIFLLLILGSQGIISFGLASIFAPQL
jgi:hypothetical protein